MIDVSYLLDDDRFLRMPEVRETTGLSRPQIYRLISRGEFPKQIKLGDEASAWLQSEIKDWMNSKIVASRKANSVGVTA